MITITTGNARHALAELGKQIQNAARDALSSTIGAAGQFARGTTLFHDQSGATRASIDARTHGAFRGTLTARGAARFLENGTAAHPIRARNAKMLRFVVNGATVFRREVYHPGTKARPFMKDAADFGDRRLQSELERLTGFATQRFNG